MCFTRFRVLEPQFGGVKRLPSQRRNKCTQCLRQPVRLGGKSGCIEWITEQWMPDMGHMNADLVGSAGFELAFKAGNLPSVTTKPGHGLIMRDGLAPVFAHRLFEAIEFVTPDRRVHSAGVRLHTSPDIGDISAF